MILSFLDLKRPWIKIFNAIIAALFIFTNLPIQLLNAQDEDVFPREETLKPVSVRSLLGIDIPPVIGALSDKYSAPSEKLVIHIQDSHAHFQAQQNITELISYFFNRFPDAVPKLILLEGAYGLVDPSVLAFLPDQDIRKRIATYFLKQGLITGAEYYSVFGDTNTLIYGVDDRNLYQGNLEAFQNVQHLGDTLKPEFDWLHQYIRSTEEYLFPERLKELNRLKRGYHDGSILLADFIALLMKFWSETGNIEILYPNIFKVVRISQIERELNQKRLNTELMALISQLQKNLVKEDLNDLVKKSILYRLGKISQGQYFRLLYEVSSKFKINFSQFPQLNAFFEAILYKESLDANQIFIELEQFDHHLREGLYTDESQRTLDRIIRYLTLIDRLAQLELSRDDYDFYQKESKELSQDTINEFLQQFSSEQDQRYYDPQRLKHIYENIHQMDAFYYAAIQRDQALLKNMLERMKIEDAPVSLLITGGFHTKGITEGLRKKQISYLVVTPHVDTPSDSTAYLSGMMDLSTPLDRELRMIASRLVASIKTAEDPFGNPAIWEEIAGKVILFRGFLSRLFQRGARLDIGKAYEEYVRDRLAGLKHINGEPVYTSQQISEKIVRMQKLIKALELRWDKMLETDNSLFVPVSVEKGPARLVHIRKGPMGHHMAEGALETGQLGDDISFEVLSENLTDAYIKLMSIQPDPATGERSISAYQLNQTLNSLGEQEIDDIAYILGAQINVALSDTAQYARTNKFLAYQSQPEQAGLFTRAVQSAYEFPEEPHVRVQAVEIVQTIAERTKKPGLLEGRYDLIHATAVAARHLLKWMNDLGGKFTNNAGDGSATKWLRSYFNTIEWMHGRVVIGEGERDEAPMLYIGEIVGKGTQHVDMGMDVVEQTKGVSKVGIKGTVSIVAYSEENGLLNAPDIYMRKIFVGQAARGAGIDVSKPVLWNMARIAAKLDKPISELKGALLYRPRHKKMIRDLMRAGIQVHRTVDSEDDADFDQFWLEIKELLKAEGIYHFGNLTLMADGDLMPVFGLETGAIDFVLGAGGAPEGTIVAAIVKSMGGEMSAQFSAYEVLQEGKEDADLERDFEKYSSSEQDRLASFGFVRPGTEMDGQRPWNKVWS
ncbi:MAG: fructose-bisphosphatase class II, partial [Chlamydiota bacterium]|nr:fructose-bisphosphatase class II [Chlamydiota bacterium]